MNNGASDNGELDADTGLQEQFDAMITLKHPEGLIKSLEANGIVADKKRVETLCRTRPYQKSEQAP